MSRYIDAETFENEMYYESFEKSSDMQKWDSGCWIRYKLFADCLEKQPTADVVEVVRCRDCQNNVANQERDTLDNTDYSGEDIVCSFFMTDGLDAVDFCSNGKKVE